MKPLKHLLFRPPALVFAIVFVASTALTQLLAYQQYKIILERRQTNLIHEAANAKDHFRDILFDDLAAANTLAITYRQHGLEKNFDSIARQIINNSRYAETLQITENGVVTNVFPDESYKTTIGTNIDRDPMRKAEEDRAVERKSIYFAGPRRLRFGDSGILGKVPIRMNNQLKAVAVVLTRMPAIRKSFHIGGLDSTRFAYELLKITGKDTSTIPLSVTRPAANSQAVSLEIPEGDWLLRVSYGEGYITNKIVYELAALGIALSLIAGLLAYRRAQEPYKLNKIIEENTRNLTQSEQRFRSAFEDASIGMGLVSIEGRWLKVNRSMYEMLGYTEAELLALTFQEITHPDDLEEDLDYLNQALRGEIDTYRMGKRYFHKDGSIVSITLNVSLVRGADRQPLYFVSQIENVSARVETQLQFRNLVDNFTVGVYIIQNGRLVYVNPNLLEETGYAEQEVINMPFEDFIYKDDLERVHEMVSLRMKEPSRAARYEVRLQRKDGRPLWFEIMGGYTQYKGAPALIGTMVNITERKAVYDNLIRSEANLRAIFETTTVSFLLLDTEYNIIALNKHMRDTYLNLTGKVLREGENVFASMLPEKRDNARRIYDMVVRTNTPKDYETSYLKDEDYRHHLANVKPINNGKKVIGVCVSSLDITERKKMNLNLLNHIQTIEEQNKRLMEIAWIQSHVVRSPLVRILGLIDLINNFENDPAEERKLLDYIADNARELDDIIKDITARIYSNEGVSG